MSKTHWKKLTNPDYLGAYSLYVNGERSELTVKIKSVSVKKVKGSDGKDQECMVAELEGHKPMVINRTNAKTISRIYGTRFIEDWAGKYITLYIADVRAFGNDEEALRIKQQVPEVKRPELTPNHPKWESAIKALKAGNTTLEKIKKAFDLSEENEVELISATHDENI